MRVLVVEDDPKIADFVVKGLRQNQFAVDHCADGDEALAWFRSVPYDAAVVDVMLPGIDGLSLIRRLRNENIPTPVLVLSARAGVDDRVRGLQSGGDDYLTKPFAFAELLARLQALIRRAGRVTDPGRLQCADLTLDLVQRRVTRAGTTLDLPPREFALLELLLRNVDRPVTKTMILEHVWDFHFDPQTNVVDVLVHRLRSKVDRGFSPRLIHTRRGVGYVLQTPPESPDTDNRPHPDEHDHE